MAISQITQNIIFTKDDLLNLTRAVDAEMLGHMNYS